VATTCRSSRTAPSANTGDTPAGDAQAETRGGMPASPCASTIPGAVRSGSGSAQGLRGSPRPSLRVLLRATIAVLSRWTIDATAIAPADLTSSMTASFSARP
jgi:hypothetical protein